MTITIFEYNPKGKPLNINQEVLTSNKILDNDDFTIQRLDPNGSERYIELPLLINGMEFTIINDGDGSNALIIQEKTAENQPAVTRLSLNNGTEKIAHIIAINGQWVIRTEGSYDNLYGDESIISNLSRNKSATMADLIMWS